MRETSSVVVVGASAGGVDALRSLVGALPADLNAAVFIVLHIPAHTASELGHVLQRVTSLPVVTPEDNDVIRAGHVYVAQADRHLMVDHDRIRVSRGPKECRSRPSIDVLFRSAAAAYGPRVIGAVLTGMLDDGTAGLWAVKDRGGVALVQDPDSAAFPGMPQSARLHVEVDEVLPLEALAGAIVRHTTMKKIDVVPESRPSMDTENSISRHGNGLQAGVMGLGKVSQYTCPDCHGVLVEIREGAILRFRCHTGHAFSLLTLLADVDEAIDKGLWDTLRAIEERVLLLRQMAGLFAEAGRDDVASQCESQAHDAEERARPLRALVLDPTLFGHAPGSGPA